MKIQVLETLFWTRRSLGILIIDSLPAEQHRQIQRLMQRRDCLTGAINAIVEAKFDDLAPGLAKAADDLQKMAEGFEKTPTVEKIESALNLVDSLIAAAGEIVQVATPHGD